MPAAGAGLEHAVAAARAAARPLRRRCVSGSGRRPAAAVWPRGAAELHAAGRVDEGRLRSSPGRRTGSRRRRRRGWPRPAAARAGRAISLAEARALGVAVAARCRPRPALARLLQQLAGVAQRAFGHASSRCGWLRPRAGSASARALGGQRALGARRRGRVVAGARRRACRWSAAPALRLSSLLALLQRVDAGLEGVGGGDAHGTSVRLASVSRRSAAACRTRDCATCSILAAAW